jgi:hypothetical protein
MESVSLWSKLQTNYNILINVTSAKSPRIPRRRWVYNIKMDLKYIGWYGLDRSGSG